MPSLNENVVKANQILSVLYLYLTIRTSINEYLAARMIEVEMLLHLVQHVSCNYRNHGYVRIEWQLCWAKEWVYCILF